MPQHMMDDEPQRRQTSWGDVTTPRDRVVVRATTPSEVFARNIRQYSTVQFREIRTRVVYEQEDRVDIVEGHPHKLRWTRYARTCTVPMIQHGARMHFNHMLDILDLVRFRLGSVQKRKSTTGENNYDIAYIQILAGPF